MKKVYALLVGINDYPTVPKLQGCLNDVQHMQDWLKRHVGAGLALEVLKDRHATRDNVIAQFDKHLGQAQAGDAVLFHYCGHGAQTYGATEFRPLQPDGLDEGLVLYDSRVKDGWDLADKELALLISRITGRGVEVAFVLDACHSGSGTRDADEFNGLTPRLAEMHPATRPLETYLNGAYLERRADPAGLVPDPGRHILLAACDRSQTAKESKVQHRGVFTTALLDVLESSRGLITYGELFTRCQAAVRTHAKNQDPRFECLGGFDAWAGFLGGAVERPTLRHRAFFSKTDALWRVDAGAVHGLGQDPGQPVTLALYKEDDLTHPLHQAHATQIDIESSTLEFDGAAPEPDARLVAAITSLPPAPLQVHCPDAALRSALQAALDGEGAPLAAGGVLLSESAAGARYAMVVADGQLHLQQPGATAAAPARVHKRVPFDPADPAAAARALQYPLRSVAQWERLLALRNRHSLIDPGQVGFALVEGAGTAAERRRTEAEITLDSTCSNGKWSEYIVKLAAIQRGEQPLHAAILHFSSDFGIRAWATDAPLPKGQWFSPMPRQMLRADGSGIGKPRETLERFKLIVSASPITVGLLTQKGLGDNTREVVELPDEPAWRPDDWQAFDLCVRIVPRTGQVAADADCKLADGHIVIRRHPRLTAQARLSATGAATRSLEEGAPFIESFASAGLALTRFGSGERGGEDTPVLEITGIQNADQLATEPLEIELHATLGSDESLLAFHHDGTHLLPCGRIQSQADGSQLLSIGHIGPNPEGERSLGSALKLYFFKTALKMDNVNRLCWVQRNEDGSCQHVKSGLPAKVAQARRIVLLVHGIIGDTQGMAAAASSCGLDGHFDLILSYDYENLNTPIEDTARRLKQDLAAVGLEAGRGRRLTVLAHSMGGLVSRWFIEREGGHELVEHLVMCGTPNQGSPFSAVDDVAHWLDYLKGLAANLIPEQLSPIAKLGRQLLEHIALTKVTKTLAQMDAASEFIRTLNSGPDPGVRYTILAGDVHAYQAPVTARFPDLLKKLGESYPFSLAFEKQPHDIAVARDSISQVGAMRDASKRPDIRQVACHHLNYFSSDAGQAELKTVAWQ